MTDYYLLLWSGKLVDYGDEGFKGYRYRWDGGYSFKKICFSELQKFCQYVRRFDDAIEIQLESVGMPELWGIGNWLENTFVKRVVDANADRHIVPDIKNGCSNVIVTSKTSETESDVHGVTLIKKSVLCNVIDIEGHLGLSAGACLMRNERGEKGALSELKDELNALEYLESQEEDK